MSKIKCASIAAVGIVVGYLLYMRIHLKTIQSMAERRMRDYHDLRVMEKLVECIQNNHDIGEFFKRNQYHTIGIYGMGIVGSLFYKELERRSIPVEFGVDIHDNCSKDGYRLLREDDNWPKVDIMIISDDFYYDKYYKKLEHRISGNIISIVDILYDIREGKAKWKMC